MRSRRFLGLHRVCETSMLTGVRLPIRWADLTFPASPSMAGIELVDGAKAWRWSQGSPQWPIPTYPAGTSEVVDGWAVDHVVVLVPDLDVARLDLADAGHRPRRSGSVRGQRALFYRVGPVLEVIELEVDEPEIFGVALATDLDLEEVTREWRLRGFQVVDPRPAVQLGRTIAVVKGLDAGLAVMSPLPLTPGRTSAPGA